MTAPDRDPSPPVETTEWGVMTEASLETRVAQAICDWLDYDTSEVALAVEVIALVREQVASEIEVLPENRSGYNGQRAVAWQMGYSHGRDDAAKTARGES